MMPKYRTVIDEYGTERFEQKPLMKWIANNFDLNKIVLAYYDGAFSKKELRKFYRDLGYSVDGYYDAFMNK
jgi:hypothetical protein